MIDQLLTKTEKDAIRWIWNNRAKLMVDPPRAKWADEAMRLVLKAAKMPKRLLSALDAETLASIYANMENNWCCSPQASPEANTLGFTRRKKDYLALAVGQQLLSHLDDLTDKR